MIIHISGAPGSGKSYLANKLKNPRYKIIDLDHQYNKIIDKFTGSVEDLKKNIAKNFQDMILSMNEKYKDKIIIYVGLNYPDPRIVFKRKEIFIKPFILKLNSTINYFINTDNQTIIENLKKREGKLDKSDRDIVSESNWWKKEFLKHKYKLMTQDEIFRELAIKN